MEVPAAHYWSSWLFQLSQMLQSHASGMWQVQMSVPGGPPVNGMEVMLLLRFSGWKE